MSVSFWLEGIAMPATSVFGLIGNIVSIHILHSSRNDLNLIKSFTNLLICLAVFDSIFLVLANTVYSYSAIIWPKQSTIQMVSAPYIIPLTHMALTGSVYSVVAITVERFVTLRRISKPKYSGRLLILFIIFFSVLYNFIRFFEFTVVWEVPDDVEYRNYDASEGNFSQTKQAMYIIRPTNLRRHPLYSLLYVVFGNILVMTFVPIVLLVVLNCLIYLMVIKSNNIHNRISRLHRRDSTMAAMLFCIVVVFFVSHSPRLVLNIYEAIQMIRFGTIKFWPEWADILTRVNHFMLVFNSSINIIIYTVKDFKFRRALAGLFCGEESQRRSGTYSWRRSRQNSPIVMTAEILIEHDHDKSSSDQKEDPVG